MRVPEVDIEAGPRATDAPTLIKTVAYLCHNGARRFARSHQATLDTPLPSKTAVIEMVEALRSVMFPGYFGHSESTSEGLPFQVGTTLDHAMRLMREQVCRAMKHLAVEGRSHGEECKECAQQIASRFLEDLPAVHKLLVADVQAALDGDPAAKSAEEVIYCYPGLLAITNYRIAHELHRLGVPLIPRIITEHAHGLTGIDFHPSAEVGESLFIDHGTGVVVGETTVIGHRVRIYQGVTLGARSLRADPDGLVARSGPRHPIVEDDVVIYAGATILGRVTIGRGSIIGGNVWLTRSVPAGSRVTQSRVREEQFEGGGGI